jgi:hypothetical protein
MEKLMRQNETTQAVGNAKFNARGDKLGPNGQIIERREDMTAIYHEATTKAQMGMKSGPVGVRPTIEKKKVQGE